MPEIGWLRGVVTGWFWARAGFYGVGAIVLALVAAPLSGLLPDAVGEWVDETSIRDLLEVLAQNMLLVATFSLGTMIAAYNAASSLASPRATKVLIDDPVSQNVLSTFVGAFVFAIIGLVSLSLGLYGEAGRTVLLFATILVVVAVIVTLFGWVDYLANLVRLGAILNKVEAAAETSLSGRHGAPCLGARLTGRDPFDGQGIQATGIGYVTAIDLDCLDRIARGHGGRIRIIAMPGSLVGRETPVAVASFSPDPEEVKELAAAFAIASERSIDQDPRYGLIVLTEVASRALSTGVNDPGTAIGIISRLQRLLTLWAEAPKAEPEIRFPHVEAPAIEAEDLCRDAFGPLARDGANIVEVGVRLQKALAVLAGLGHPDLAGAALHQSERALAQAGAALVLEGDRAEIARLAEAVRARADAAAGGRAR